MIITAIFYITAGDYYFYLENQIPTAMHYLEKALALSRSYGDTNAQCHALNIIAWINFTVGDLCAAQSNINEARKLATMSANLYEEVRLCLSL
jgi:hypothetical protein